MATEFSLSVVAPDRAVVEEKVGSVVAPGQEGYFGVLAGHAPMIAALKPGLLEYTDHIGTRHYVYVGGGFAEVGSNQVTILADEAARSRDIDLAKAEQALDSARRTLRGEDGSTSNDDAVLEVERAVERLRVARLGR